MPSDSHLAENLRRWQESGAPRRWVDARQGRWDHIDWLALLDDLGRSPYWPLDPDAVGQALEQARQRRHNLRRWERSGQARQWVAGRQGRWGHEDWLALLDDLSRSPFGPLDPEAVGEVLEELGQEWANLRRWEDSGAARRWLAARGGRWDRADWPALRDDLRRSAFWPVDPEAAEGVLERLASEWTNLRRWQEAGAAARWVEARQGRWGHEDWSALLDDLRRSAFWPLDPEQVGHLLEACKLEWWNLDRWRASGLARRWVEARQGEWTCADWVALQDDLRRSGFWPVDPGSLGRLLEGVRAEWRNLQRWRQSGQPQQWVDSRRGRWGPGDLDTLLEALRRGEYWPVDQHAVRELLERLPASATPTPGWAGERSESLAARLSLAQMDPPAPAATALHRRQAVR